MIDPDQTEIDQNPEMIHLTMKKKCQIGKGQSPTTMTNNLGGDEINTRTQEESATQDGIACTTPERTRGAKIARRG